LIVFRALVPAAILAAAFRADCRAVSVDHPPLYLRAQFAGSQGLVSAGAGTSFRNGAIEPDLEFGYVPAWAGGTTIASLAQTTTFSLFPTPVGGSGSWHPAILGYSAQIAWGDDYFLYGKKYVGYYWPSALHFRFFTGTSYYRRPSAIPRRSGWTGSLQVGAIDSEWMACLDNRSIGLGDILTAAVALNVYFGREDSGRPFSRIRENRDKSIP
jgi:hypothetical protein